MNKLRSIASGVLGGAAYSWLATIALAKSHALAWPDGYAEFAINYPHLGVLLWDAAVAWLPCLLIAVMVGLICRAVLRAGALTVALTGALVILIYLIVDSVSRGYPSALLDIHVLVVIAIFPLGILLAQAHKKPSNATAGGAERR